MAIDIFGRDTETEGYVEAPAPEYFPLQASREVPTSIASDILGFTGAAVGDFATSVYNSVVPEDSEVDTADFLKRISPNAARMYDEQEDAVHLASFIGGVFAPAGIALKGMKMARDGVKGMSWFSTAGKADQLAAANATLKESGIANAAYKSAVTKLYARDVANVVVDNAAVELAIIGTMNAHPFMEDYMKDPVSSFTTSMMLGTALTAPLSHIAARGEIRRAAQEVYLPAIKTVEGLTTEVKLTEDFSAQIAGHQMNIDNYKNVLKEAEEGKRELDTITTDFLVGFLKTEQDRQLTAFNKMATGEMASPELPKEFRDFIITELAGDAAKFAGINTIRFASAAEEISLADMKAGKLLPSTKLGTSVPLTTRIKTGANAGDLRPTNLIYSQRLGAFVTKGDFKNYGVAADLATNVDELTAGLTSDWFRAINPDAWEESLLASSAKMDLDYLKMLKAVDEIPITKLGKIVVNPDDGPRLNAILARIEKLGQTDPKLASELRVTMTKNEPNWDAVAKQQESQLPVIGRNPSANGVGVKSNYLQDLTALNSKWDGFDLLKNSPNLAAKNLLNGWMNASGMTTLRKAVDDAYRGSNYASHGSSATHIKAVKDLYDSPASSGLRAELMKIADSNGDVYLYRGLRKEGFGSSAVESFTTNAAKAAEFGTPKLYKVKVKDVLGGIRDIKGRAGYDNSTEILVMSTTRDAVKDLPIAERLTQMPAEYLKPETFGILPKDIKSWDKQNIKNLTLNLFEDFHTSNPLASFKGTPEEYKLQLEAFLKAGVDEYVAEANKFASLKESSGTVNKTEAGYADLRKAFEQYQQNGMKTMLSQGLAPEAIELRLGMPKGSASALIAGTPFDQVPSRAYTSSDVVGTFINNQNRSIEIGTSANRLPQALMRANQLAKHADDSDRAIKSLMIARSQSGIAKSVAEFVDRQDNIFRIDVLKKELANINPATMSSRFVFSSDFAARDMGQAGKILVEIGKDTTHLKNAAVNQHLPAVSSAYAQVLKDKAATVEFMQAYNLNASLPGYREYRDGKFWKQHPDQPWTKMPDGSKVRNMVEVESNGKVFEILTPSVKEAFEAQQVLGRELYQAETTRRQILGQPALSDTGYWNPALNLSDKNVTYVFDRNTQTTRVIWGYTPEELALNEKAFLATLTDTQKKFTDIIRKGVDQEQYNRMAARHNPMFMSEADIGMQHSGASSQALINLNTNLFADLATGYERALHRQVEGLMEIQYSDVFATFQKLDIEARRAAEANKGNFMQQALNKSPNAGSFAYNTMLGRGDLKDYVAWTSAQNGIQAAAEISLQHIRKAIDPILNPAKGFFGKGKSLTDKDYENLMFELDARGIVNPFEAMDTALAKEVYHVQNLAQAPNMTPRLVATSNALAATVMLRVMELGQPLVNMLSLPVLTSAAVQQRFSSEFMGAQLSKNFHLSTTAAMYDGVRFLGHPEYAKYKKLGEELGIMKPIVSEVSDVLSMTRRGQPGLLGKVETALNYVPPKAGELEENVAGKLINLLSKPADWAEGASREFAFATGVSLAKKAYPGLGDAGVMTFARNFVDTAIGNYNPAQRPTVFQGTLGVAMGLFQTYMVTLAQQIYRRAELQDWKSLAKIMLTQASVFGVKGLPGFNMVSETIGDKFSDQNYDLTTGMYRAVGDDAADLILYGLPSNLGPAVYTRGDIQPRLANPVMGLQNLAAVNILGSATDAASRMVRATKEMGDEGTTHAFMEALSMQAISRPIARMSELVTGHAVTRDGNEIAGPEEIYSAQGISARLFATRSLTEAKAREARHLKNLYRSLDKESRAEAKQVLANHVRSGTLTSDIVERVQEKYMRSGSSQGWRSMVDSVLRDTDSPGVSATRNYLGPSHPAYQMIEDID